MATSVRQAPDPIPCVPPDVPAPSLVPVLIPLVTRHFRKACRLNNGESMHITCEPVERKCSLDKKTDFHFVVKVSLTCYIIELYINVSQGLRSSRTPTTALRIRMLSQRGDTLLAIFQKPHHFILE